ncbi:MAG: DUF4388 domain-containing protein [Candidatus Brocadiae bacterium]|nr:DUF4388 domain-containing protein [Candidatus Brocadiia bacterium]
MKDFDTFGLPHIFQTISDGEKTGTLRVQKEEKEVNICFLQGMVKMATSPHKRSVLAEGLIRCYEIEKETLDAIFAKQRETKKSLFSTLKEMPDKKLRDQEFILKICGNQIQEEIYELFQWEDVSCEFMEDTIPENIFDQELFDLPIALNPQAIVMESAKRKDEWGIIRSTIFSNKDIPYLVQEKNPSWEGEEKDKANIMQLVQEIPDFQEILNKIGWQNEEIIDLFVSLLQTGTISGKKSKELRKVLEILSLLVSIPNNEEILIKIRLNYFKIVKILAELESKEKISTSNEDIRKVLSILESINGMRDFDEILEQVRMSSFEALKICTSLIIEKKIQMKSFEELMLMASWDLIREDTFKCIKIYERVEELGYKNLETVRWLARAYEKCELTNKSLEKYRELGEISLANNLYEEAIRSYKQVIAFAPEDLEVYEKLINVYNKNGQKEKSAEVSAIYARKVAVFDKRKAIMVLDEANKNYPSSPSNLELMAMLYLDMGVKENAILTYTILANLMRKQEKLEKCLDAYDKIIHLDPKNIKAHLELAKGYIELNKIPEGIERYKTLGALLHSQIVGKKSKDVQDLIDILLNVCECIICYDMNNIDAREWQVDTYIALDDSKTALNILREIKFLLQKESNFDKFILILKRIVSMDSEDFHSRKVLADTLLKQKKRNAAINEYMQLGVKSFEKNDIRRAKEAFDSVLNIDPFNLTARQRKSDILNMLNLQAKAVEEYKLVGYLAKAVGMLPEAAQAFSQVVELASDKELWSFLEVARLYEQIQENKKAVFYYKQYGIRNLNRGNYGEIDYICSKILDLEPGDTEAVNMKKIAQAKFDLLNRYLEQLEKRKS